MADKVWPWVDAYSCELAVLVIGVLVLSLASIWSEYLAEVVFQASDSWDYTLQQYRRDATSTDPYFRRRARRLWLRLPQTYVEGLAEAWPACEAGWMGAGAVIPPIFVSGAVVLACCVAVGRATQVGRELTLVWACASWIGVLWVYARRRWLRADF